MSGDQEWRRCLGQRRNIYWCCACACNTIRIHVMGRPRRCAYQCTFSLGAPVACFGDSRQPVNVHRRRRCCCCHCCSHINSSSLSVLGHKTSAKYSGGEEINYPGKLEVMYDDRTTPNEKKKHKTERKIHLLHRHRIRCTTLC